MPKISSHPRHSEEKKNQFIGAMLVQPDIKSHAARFGIPYETARKIWKKYRDTGSAKNRPPSGRPKKVTGEMEANIIQTARENRRMPFGDIGNMMDPPISDTAVGKVLDSVGMHRRVARHVPFLTEMHKEDRLEWATANKGRSMRAWEKIMWSDECYVHLNGTSGRVWVTRTSDEVYEESCLVPAFKQSPVRVMVWGCIAHGWKGPLVILKYPGGKGSGMTAERYQDQVLKPHLMNAINELRQQRSRRVKIQFQQDGASSHTAHSSIDWLENHKIPIFLHPANSPDLSPIEPVWHELKKCIRARILRPTTFESLKTAILEEWEKLPIEDINKYTGTMVNRVQAVLDAEGGHTRY
ncbi:unnamed protein product [Mycena citricolor]|uniref:Transposase n=1 Tax=Mycena citricolor TaxID=2018698 RepID=A0AAD2HEF3_9AGAR|nr:unnamed protein product [Mycena citricolor]